MSNPPWVVAHILQHEMKRKVECCRAVLHCIFPFLYRSDVAVRKLPDGKLAYQRAMVQQLHNKFCGHSLHVVQPKSLHIERPSQPVCSVHQSVATMVPWHAVDGRQIASELKLIGEDARIFGNMRMEVARFLLKSSALTSSKRIGVLKLEMAIVAVPL